MSVGIAVSLVAAAALLLPGPAAVTPAAESPADRRPADRVDDRADDRRIDAVPDARSGGRVGPAVAVLAVGLACLAVAGIRTGLVAGAVLCPATALGTTRLQRRPVPVRPDRSLALVLDLAAAALRSGRPVADALAMAAPAGRADVALMLRRVSGLSRLGADATQAWSAVPREGPLGEVAAVAVRSAASGLKLAAGLERLAVQIRLERSAEAAVRAHRAGVTAMAPLAACFLPSFVCLGVIPVVVGVARSAFGVLP